MEKLASLIRIIYSCIGGIVACTIALAIIVAGIGYPICKIKDADDWTDIAWLICYTLFITSMTILVYWAFNH